MSKPENILLAKPIIYITRDIERALGISLDTSGYFIISNYSSFAKSIAGNRNNVLLINEKHILDTRELIKNEIAIDKIKTWKQKFFPNENPNILVFKNTPQIEKNCHDLGWHLLNPSADLANEIEEKISQIKWLGTLKKYLPPHQIIQTQNLMWKKQKFIVQFNHSHTGSGTILINSEKQVAEIKNKFPLRQVRVFKYISGSLFTNNNIVTNKKIYFGNINYQITGIPPFTDNPLSTIGNDWSLPTKYLSKKQQSQYHHIVNEIGKKMQKQGWRGLFGVDIIAENTTGKLYLIEINARQPASTTYESELQTDRHGTKVNSGITTFYAHLAALTNVELGHKQLIKITDGAQIIQRVTQKIQKIKPLKFPSDLKLNVLYYRNQKTESDLIRIQSRQGIMKSPNKFNKIGQNISNIINNSLIKNYKITTPRVVTRRVKN